MDLPGSSELVADKAGVGGVEAVLCADELELGCAGEPAVLALAIARDVQEADQPLACTAALLNYLREKGQIAGLHVKLK